MSEKIIIITAAVLLLTAGYAPRDAGADIPASERAALADFYISTGGADWTGSTGWNGSPGTECGWHGVTCDSQGEHVTKLELVSNSLNGNIPESVGNLTSLYAVNLSYNSLSGNIPASVGDLGMLRALDLGANDLTGAIPREIGNILSLQYLFLHGNRLSGNIPPELGNLARLRLLKLGVNDLTGTVPPELGKLSDLRYLTLYKNRLEGVIPPALGNLANLTELNVLGNSLSGPVPAELRNLGSLRPGGSDFRWNALYSGDDSTDAFLTSVQRDSDWKSTQTVAPAGLAGTPSPGAVRLSWEPVSAADEYEILYSDVPGGPYTVFRSTPATELTLTGLSGLPPGTAWHFRVRSVTLPHEKNSGTVRSTHSDEVSLTIPTQGQILTLDGPDTRTVYDDLILVTGTVADPQYSVTAVSDRYPDITFAAVTEDSGVFSCEAPLLTGTNLLTFIARDTAGSEVRKDITVIFSLPLVPKISITEPPDGITVYKETVTVSGTLRSAPDPAQITLTLDGQTAVPSGEEGEYTFVFENVGLAKGENILVVVAETAYGSASGQVTVNYTDPGGEEEIPTIEIHSPVPGAFLAEEPVIVKGTAGSSQGIKSVTVNGHEAQIFGSGAEVSFTYAMMFPEGGDELQTDVTATDSAGRSGSLSFAVKYDSTFPVITLTSPDLRPSPEISSVKETPYPLAGIVTEKNLAGVSVNGRNIGVLPAGADGTWSFEGSVGLVRGQEHPVTIGAWDHAGNGTGRELTLRLDSALAIEVISPEQGKQLVADGETLDVSVTLRVPGIAEGDRVTVRADGGNISDLSLSGTTASGTVSIAATDGKHELTAEAVSAAGEVLARTTVSITVTNMANIPVTVVRQEPENGAGNAETNTFLTFYFSRPADPQQLEIEVSETAHGQVYDTPEQGADLTQISDIRLAEVHRSRDPVPGNVTLVPDNSAAAVVVFYPKRNFAYSGTVYVTVRYSGKEISRSFFNIRPLPTFVRGFVAAGRPAVPVAGLEVVLPELARKTVTDSSGMYGFGFGEPAGLAVPPGTYHAVINPGLGNRAFGTVEVRVSVQEGYLNTVGVTPVPVLDPGEPFRHIASGQQYPAVLAGGGLILDLGGATLRFPDGRDSGDVHVQFAEQSDIAYSFLGSASSHWTFAVQPAGIGVSGSVGMTFSMRPLYGRYDYIRNIGKRVLITGLHPGALKIVPVGTGIADTEKRQVTSEGKTEPGRLDYLGYAVVSPDSQPILERFAKGEIRLTEMISELELRD